MSPTSEVFGIVVTEVFPNQAEREKFIVAFRELAGYIHKEEPQTLMYKLLVADDDPLKTVLIERYASKEAWRDVHEQSAAYKAFCKKRSGFSSVSREVVFCCETEHGFSQRERPASTT